MKLIEPNPRRAFKEVFVRNSSKDSTIITSGPEKLTVNFLKVRQKSI